MAQGHEHVHHHEGELHVHYWQWIIGGMFALIALLGALTLRQGHMKNYSNPKRQNFILIICYMTPLFASSSFIGLLGEWMGLGFLILDSIKECYEAFVIHSFLQLLYDYMKVELGKPLEDGVKGRHVHQIFPMNLFYNDWHLDPSVVRTLHYWTLQFVYIRPIISILEIVAEITETESYTHIIFAIILNISVTLAVYALMMFYHAFEKELAPHRPLAKFLCIKGVVFFAFWQGIIIQLLVYFGIITKDHWHSVEQVEVNIQNLLVCVEMGLIFTYANYYAFNPSEFSKEKAELEKKKKS